MHSDVVYDDYPSIQNLLYSQLCACLVTSWHLNHHTNSSLRLLAHTHELLYTHFYHCCHFKHRYKLFSILHEFHGCGSVSDYSDCNSE